MATITSAQDGDWNDGTTWTGGSVPVAGDYVMINHAVTLNANATAGTIYIVNGSLTTADTWTMQTDATLTCDYLEMYRKLEDTRKVRLDGINLRITYPSLTAIKSSDSFPYTVGVISTLYKSVIIDDPGMPAYTAKMQDIGPEGCARAYARKVSNGVRYMNINVHIKNSYGHIMGQLYRMAENPFQVLAVTNSAVIKGHIEAITPLDSVGKEYRSFRVSIAEGPSE